MREFLTIAKAMSDENRARVLMFLHSGELCVCQIIEMLGLAPSTVSKHMSVLYQARLVDYRKEGRWIYYRLADEGAPAAVVEAINWLRRSLARDPRIRQDEQKLKHVRRMSQVELCVHYRVQPDEEHAVRC